MKDYKVVTYGSANKGILVPEAIRTAIQKKHPGSDSLIASWEDDKIVIKASATKADRKALARRILHNYCNCDVYFYRERNAVVCISVYDDGLPPRFGMAFCHPDDEYDSTIGKAIALLRLIGRSVPRELTGY